MSAPTPSPTPAPADAAAVRLRADARAVVRRLACAPASDIALELAATWEVCPPTTSAVTAALGDDPAVHALPDRRLVHLLGAVEGRLFTTRADSCGDGDGPVVLRVEPDLAIALLPYRSWSRIPVRMGRHRGMVERARTGTGSDVLVLHPTLVPAAPLVAVMPGPEGLRLAGAVADDLATATLARCLAGPASAHAGDSRRPSSWSPVDRLLLALASDASLCRAPAEPIGQLLRRVAHRGHHEAA